MASPDSTAVKRIARVFPFLKLEIVKIPPELSAATFIDLGAFAVSASVFRIITTLLASSTVPELIPVALLYPTK